MGLARFVCLAHLAVSAGLCIVGRAVTLKAPPEYTAAARKRGFENLAWIGGGAYGTVYKAEQVSLRRPVAIKFFDKGLTKDAANRKRFEREAPLLARVQHPAIPYVITTGTAALSDGAEIPFSVMEYIAGSSLDRLLAGGKIELSLVYRVMQNVLSALEAAHQLKVVHRDVKPDNIVVSEHGAYLIDFSIGICLVHEPGLTRATRMGERVGTAEYAAPEQFLDSSTVDHRADIYSAGVVLAEMLGARPRLRLDALDSEIPQVSSRLREVVRRAAAERPGDRFPRAIDFLAAIDAVLGPRVPDGLEEAKRVLCPNLKCGSARFSNGSARYYWGPNVMGPTAERFCESCGTEYLRGCPKCHRALPANIEALVVKRAKADRDALQAHCSGCGTLIFRTPTCVRCGSYLKSEDLGSDTTTLGCADCRLRSPPPRPASPSDDDIPF